MQRKINFLLIFLVVFGILISGILEQNMMNKSYIEDIQDRLISNSRIIGEGLTNFDYLFSNDAKKFLLNSSKSAKSRITIIDNKGIVIFDSEKNSNEMENHKDRPEIALAYDNKIGVSKRYSKTIRMDMYYVAIPYSHRDGKFVIRVALPLSKIKENNLAIIFNIVFASVIGIFLSLVVGTKLSKKITEPIKTLTIATKTVSGGKYDRRVYLKTNDELGELAHNFNLMSDEINRKIMEINDRNIKTNAILSSMINGVIAVDNSKKIMFVNLAAENMFGFKENDVKGKYILEVLRNSDLDEQLQIMINKNIMTTIEIETNFPENRVFNLYSNPIVTSEIGNEKIGVVMIIQDITEMKKLENMRKDFVANVSHELKTPLTSIKGFVETLVDGAVENNEIRDKFLGIINVEVNRLNSLIEDLLILSEIEKTEKIYRTEEINLNYSVRNIIEMLSEIAKKNNVSLLYNCDSDLPAIYGNESLFKQMIVNLVDNAIKYNKDGGNVYFKIKKENDNVIISVKDDGLGIDEEHLERLFERFYRVDKSRTRNVGGTGLGLAIVKHVVLSFDGTISVKSVLGEGSEFIVEIPIFQKNDSLHGINLRKTNL